MHVRLADSVSDRLKQLGRSEHRPVAAVMRQALVEWLAQHDADNLSPGHETATDGPRVATEELVSVSEIARRSRRPISTIQSWRRRYTSFPEPLARLAAGPLWDWPAVAQWVARHEAGELGRRLGARDEGFASDLPGADLVSAGLRDLALGRSTAEAALVSMATSRLRELGIRIPGRPVPDPADRLYELVEKQVGEASAHSRYNALRRRLASFMRSQAIQHAQGG